MQPRHGRAPRRCRGRRGVALNGPFAALLTLLVAGCALLPPGADPIPASRPGLSDDPDVVAPGSLQAEGGYEYARISGTGREGAAELLIRIGLVERIEARLGIGSETAPANGGARSTNVEDIEVGFKIGLMDGEAHVLAPMISILPVATLPTGASAVSAGEVQPAATLLFTWGMDGGTELNANVGAAHVREDEERSTELFLAVGAGRAVSERLAVEVEFVRIAPFGGGAALHHLAGGVAILVNPDLQLDAWTGWARAEGSRAFLLGAGVSRRWSLRR